MSVTKKRDLHTDTPLWSSTPRIAVRSRQERYPGTREVIVGAGISAAQVAAALVGCRRASLVVERQRDIVTVMGFGGNGITFSQIASELVASRLDGRTDGDFDLFRFNPPPAPRKAA